MTGFLGSIVSRFNGAENIISPRLPGRFESSYHDEPNLIDEPRSTVGNYDSEATEEDTGYRPGAVQTRWAKSNVNNDRIADEDKRNDDQEDHLPFDHNKQYPSIRNTSLPVQEFQRDGQIEEEERMNQVRPRAKPVQVSDVDEVDSSDIHPRRAHEPRIREHPEDDTSGRVVPQEGLLHLIEKEQQRSAVRQSVISPVVSQAVESNSGRLPELNFRASAIQDHAPIVKISIGRIEVRAVPAPTGSKSRDNGTQKPQISLDEYLQKRNKRP